jgi:hypothetical protein
LYLVSDDTLERGLHHLKWRVMDTPARVLERARVYILLSMLITRGAR